MKITGVYVLDKCLPCAGRQYCVAKITAAEGDIPEEIMALAYPDGKERVTNAGNGATAPFDTLGSVYVIVEDVTSASTAEGNRDFRVVTSIDDFMAPLEFNPILIKEFTEFYFGRKAEQAGMKMVTFDLELDEEDVAVESPDTADEYAVAEDGIDTSKAFCFYCTNEMAWVHADMTMDAFVKTVGYERTAALKSDNGIMMVFGAAMEGAVTVYNNINVHQKAKDIADTISEIRYINDRGEKGPLTITAVENLLSNIKDNIHIG